MPTLAAITVKKADGTTNVVYTAIAGSAGDQNPAVFRNDSVGTTVAERPTVLVKSASNGPRTARRVSVDFAWPTTTQDAAGNKVVTGRMSGSTTVLIPQNQTAAVISEQCAQFCNLMAAALIRASFEEGYAPR